MTATPAATTPPRFSWPKRLLISFLLFDMVVHSLIVLPPYPDWLQELDMRHFPEPLPTPAQIERLAAEQPPSVAAERVTRSLGSLPGYFNPWPSATTRDRLDSPEQWGKYLLCWTASRLDFLDNLIGVPQRWTMFSGSVAEKHAMARMRLVFADGSTQEIRLAADPEDLTRYSHWFQEKLLCCELSLHRDDARLGYCRRLALLHATNEKGSPLVEIYTYFVEYHYPGPGVDAREFLQAQNGPPGWDSSGPRYVYEVRHDRERVGSKAK